MYSANMCNIFCVMVFHISMVNWRRGFKTSCHHPPKDLGVVVFHKSMVSCRGLKLMHCSGVLEIYCQL